MAIPSSLLTTTCDIYRPFGSGSPTTSGVACRMVASLRSGRSPGGSNLLWTHYIDVSDTVDIRDGCSRTSGGNAILYADGDEIRVPSGGTSRFVVVWVETHNLGTSNQFKRAYLMRHSA
jgi:hypothetical protein